MPPTVSSLSPTSGTTAGQVLFTIMGTNLGVAGSTTVTFGGGRRPRRFRSTVRRPR
ncbi:IPT/TIG domain-containing protein [Streptomyces sioyaensis]|uniref:IPT/TIG domain-containing protein n=1 Tax=Streptomyces sioyaensis TaxID=67364 RepID=UPI0033EBB109